METYSKFEKVQFQVYHNLGYNGFSSQLAANIFGISPQWDAYEFYTKHLSEHTIDDRRFDFEI